MKIYEGTIKKVYFHSKETQWTSMLLTLKDNSTVRAAGIIKGPNEGCEVVLEGELVFDEKYGEQIKFSTGKVAMPTDRDGIILALSSGLYPGIGKSTAAKIYDKFGADSMQIVKEKTDMLIEVSGFSTAKITKLKDSMKESKNIEDIISFTHGVVTLNQAYKIDNEYHEKSISQLKTNPYDMIEKIDGFGFIKVDTIARATGVAFDSMDRIKSACVHVLKDQSEKNGHVFINADLLQQEVLTLLLPFSGIHLSDKRKENKFLNFMITQYEIFEENPDKYIEEYKLNKNDLEYIENWAQMRLSIVKKLFLILNKQVKSEKIYIDDDNNIYYLNLYLAENYCAEKLVELTKSKMIKLITSEDIKNGIEAAEVKNGYPLGSEQKDAIVTGVKSRVSIITGGPGRGKTTVIGTIIDIWNDTDSILLCAPTGRAAQRMKESTGHEASTIHRLCALNKETTDKLIICDECSMLDMTLAQKLINLVMSGDNALILVGDVDQLPSIGAGLFFRDIILTKIIPTTFLKQGYRNEGAIAKNSESINNGKSFKNMILNDTFKFIECDHELLQENLIKKYGELLETNDPKDICVLTPMRTRSSSGSDLVNKMIREKYNPVTDPVYEECAFRPNDRVMCVKNNALKSIIKNGTEEKGVFNGDCGTVINVNLDDGITTILFDDGRIGDFIDFELSDFVLAYAITIHKSQGSEYKNIILTMTTEHYIMLQRNLLYTAVTRAKTNVLILGQSKAFNLAIRNTDYKERNSKLRKKMLSLVE